MRPWQRPPPPVCIKMARARAAAQRTQLKVGREILIRLDAEPQARFLGLEQLSVEEVDELVERMNQLVLDEAERRRARRGLL